jgi:fibronectin type 3 domain-containing protein
MLHLVVLETTFIGGFMKKIILAVLVLNSLSVFAVGLGQKEDSQCTALTQSGRNSELQKEVKEKTKSIQEEQAIIK